MKETRTYRAIRDSYGYMGRFWQTGDELVWRTGDPEVPHHFELVGSKEEPEEVEAGDVFPKAAGPGRWLMPDGSYFKGKKVDAIAALQTPSEQNDINTGNQDNANTDTQNADNAQNEQTNGNE